MFKVQTLLCCHCIFLKYFLFLKNISNMYSLVMIQYVTLLEQTQCLDPFFRTFDACEVTLKMDLKRTQKKHSNWYNSIKYFVIKTNLWFFYTIFHTFKSYSRCPWWKNKVFNSKFLVIFTTIKKETFILNDYLEREQNYIKITFLLHM